MDWHIGCSGFHYRDWKGVFYPSDLPQKRWFEYYSSRFDTLELNVTFYRFPQLKFLQNWYSISPPDFVFSAKVPRLITHYKRLNNCEDLLRDFYITMRNGLGEKLGGVLFQLPPSMQYSPALLDTLSDLLSVEFINVVEFRHASWQSKTVLDKLKRKGIIVSGLSHPRLTHAGIINDNVAYYRFHGVPDIYYSVYSTATLRIIVDQFLQKEKLQEVFIYFNNTATPGAIKNATWLKNYVRKHE